jgi:hypothetical protein
MNVAVSSPPESARCALQQLYCTAEYLNNPIAFIDQLFGS